MYYVDAPTVTVEFWTGTASKDVYFFTALFTATTYLLAGWARDSFALAIPAKILCKEDCAGLCPVCAADLNDLDPAGPEHRHEAAPDPRWAKLRELELE